LIWKVDRKGIDAWEIDKGILTRGAIIALLDITVISFGSGHWNIGRPDGESGYR